MMTEVMERVSRGTALLDERVPDWYRKIDTETLTIASGRRCICGQLYGEFGVGVMALGISGTPHMYGFNGGAQTPIEELDAAWRQAIADRIMAEVSELVPA